MAERIEALGSKVEEKRQYIVVKLGNEQFGIDISLIENIVRMQRITRVPKAQKYYKGVINLRGDVVPVMSMRIRMGMEPDEYTNTTRIIIAKFENNAYVGFIVDEVMQIVNIDENTLEKPTFRNQRSIDNYLMGVAKDNDTLISVINMNMLVEEEEFQ
ncbi:MAG: purine-binding chemotaxis protein CheW [Lachnospiraceae bacterium]|nr:purine-binding chemotaxis protein CheW [Lachnospiraceae bacterium]